MTTALTLVVDRRDARVSIEGRALRIERDGEALRRVPLGLLDLFVVHGSPWVRADVWRALAERGIPAVVQSARGSATAWVGAAIGHSVVQRTIQHRAADDEGRRTDIARWLVDGKLASLGDLSLDGTRLAPDFVRQLETARASLTQAGDTNTLMGIEGAAAARWWAYLADRLPPEWKFSGRNRRPPRDPLNSLLSLGYTLLGAEMLAAVQRRGLDPALGFLHGVVPGRDSLVLDLIEPLRPGVDAFALGLLEGKLQPADFSTSTSEGCRLRKQMRGVFYAAWADARAHWTWPPRLAGVAGDSTEDHSLPAWCNRVVAALVARLGQLESGRDDVPRPIPGAPDGG
ncbi:MAG: CRISPR-associated endonuclease Cas1 [Chromatiales bacterium]|nr:CRISPR-associated endonuclease Cas1 [Chromatiales bacterium]